MAGFEKQLKELQALDVSVIAGSVDDVEKAGEIAADLSYPMAHGVTKEQADMLGSFWEDRRSIIQPSEFILDGDGNVLNLMYAAGPIGRINAEEAVTYITFLESKKN